MKRTSELNNRNREGTETNLLKASEPEMVRSKLTPRQRKANNRKQWSNRTWKWSQCKHITEAELGISKLALRYETANILFIKWLLFYDFVNVCLKGRYTWIRNT